MKNGRATPKRLEVKDGNVTVPIYQYSDGRFCVDTMLGTKRKRITRTTLEAAKIEARKILAKIASGRHHEDTLSTSEIQDYRLAKQQLKDLDVSLIQVVEEWLAARKTRSLLSPKAVPEIVEEFLTTKQVEGAGFFHLEDRKYRLQKFAKSFPGRIDRVTTHEIEVWLNGLGTGGRTRNNYRNAILQLFRYARGKRYLLRNEPTVVEDVAAAIDGEGEIEIYTSDELRLLLLNAPVKLLPFFAVGAFAGLRSQEIMRLDWKDVQFEKDFIEVPAIKAKTASRRLVPLLPALKAWLLPLRQSEGHIVGYTRNDVLSQARQKFCKTGIEVNGKAVEFTWKPNALRHSYASYRLAAVKSAAEVALEMGNSPAMLFRNYRELVTEAQAKEWFSVFPAKEPREVANPLRPKPHLRRAPSS